MLSRAFEWYRTVNPSPSTTVLDSRKASAAAIEKQLRESDTNELALSCLSGVISGFAGRFQQTSKTVQFLVEAIKSEDSAFPQDLTENDLELRVIAALALGEVLSPAAEPTSLSDQAVLLASMLRAGMGLRQQTPRDHFDTVLIELTEAADAIIGSAARQKRNRATDLGTSLASLTIPADATAGGKVFSALKSIVEEINEQLSIDREELEILWWMFSGFSGIAGKPLAALQIGSVALCAGIEIADRCIPPGIPSLEAIAVRACESGRTGTDLEAKTLERIASDWDEALLTALALTEADRKLSLQYPAFLPLTWLAQRLVANRGSSGWGEEYMKITGLKPATLRAPGQWAVQFLKERVALRLYATGHD